MRVRLASLFLAILVVPAVAFAESHKADFYLGSSGGSGGSTIGGFIAGSNWGTPCPWFDVVGPVFSTQGGGHESKALSQTVFQGGARLTLSAMNRDRAAEANEAPDKNGNKKKLYFDRGWKPFAQALVGGTIVNINDGSAKAIKDWSYTLGVGVDKFWHTMKRDGRVHYFGAGVRVQVDYVIRPGDHTNFTRVSGGFVYRVPGHLGEQ